MTRRSMTEENVRDEAGPSHDPQTEIARLNEKIARLEKELQERDRTEQQETQEEVSQSGQKNLKRDAGPPEGAAGDEDETDSDAELANPPKKDEKGKKKWVEKLTKLEQQCDYLMGSAQAGVTGKALLCPLLLNISCHANSQTSSRCPRYRCIRGWGTLSSTWQVSVRMWRFMPRRTRSRVERSPLPWQEEPGSGSGPCHPARSRTLKALL
jgi:hypothetical protein